MNTEQQQERILFQAYRMFMGIAGLIVVVLGGLAFAEGRWGAVVFLVIVAWVMFTTAMYLSDTVALMEEVR